jgi:Signal transduction histidine kinase
MFLFKRLWQRVFVYSLILVIASGAMGTFLVHRNLTSEASAVVFNFTKELRNALKGLSAREAHTLLMRFNTQEARFWLENDQGEMVAGQRYAGRDGKGWSEHLRSVRYSGDVALWQTDLKKPLFLAMTPCELKDESATLHAAYMAFPVPPLETLLSPGLITLALITGLLALWMAVKVGRPLRKLRHEVSEISGSPPQLRSVTVSGADEIADVAKAVNRLVDSLRSHIDGMNQLVVNISHELRSPITRMSLSTEMIGEGLALLKRCAKGSARDEAVKRLAEGNLDALRQELLHMDKLIGDTLLTSKLEMQNPGELKGVVSLSALCVSAAERHEAVFRRAGIRFMRNVEDGLSITGDETLLKQVVSNLLDNAAKYAAGPEPLARMRLCREERRAVLTVENTYGPPFPEDVLEHLFDPYFRYNQQASTGVGLGLAILKKTVSLHGGDARAMNTGGGVLFRLSFPLWGTLSAKADQL